MKSRGAVLIVDDDESVRNAVVRLMVLEGYTAEGFPSGRSFLDSVPPDTKGCLVTDIYMPEMDGFSLQKKMRQLGYTLPIIFMSAQARADDRDYAVEHGAAGFLLKPFENKSLLEIVEKVLE
jgi:FixJ family two-component response regulator